MKLPPRIHMCRMIIGTATLPLNCFLQYCVNVVEFYCVRKSSRMSHSPFLFEQALWESFASQKNRRIDASASEAKTETLMERFPRLPYEGHFNLRWETCQEGSSINISFGRWEMRWTSFVTYGKEVLRARKLMIAERAYMSDQCTNVNGKLYQVWGWKPDYQAWARKFSRCLFAKKLN